MPCYRLHSRSNKCSILASTSPWVFMIGFSSISVSSTHYGWYEYSKRTCKQLVVWLRPSFFCPSVDVFSVSFCLFAVVFYRRVPVASSDWDFQLGCIRLGTSPDMHTICKTNVFFFGYITLVLWCCWLFHLYYNICSAVLFFSSCAFEHISPFVFGGYVIWQAASDDVHIFCV